MVVRVLLLLRKKKKKEEGRRSTHLVPDELEAVHPGPRERPPRWLFFGDVDDHLLLPLLLLLLALVAGASVLVVAKFSKELVDRDLVPAFAERLALLPHVQSHRLESVVVLESLGSVPV